jgi:hypothetical protein
MALFQAQPGLQKEKNSGENFCNMAFEINN